MIIRVDYSADGVGHGDWSCEIQDDIGRPIGRIPERALDDAVFFLNEFRDMRPMRDLQDTRELRAQRIRDHFLVCAEKLIQEIEAGEGWNEWQGRIKK